MIPRVACLGVGWIGRSRMLALARSGAATVTHVADEDPGAAAESAAEVGAEVVDVEALLDGTVPVDGVLVATPSALHAEQSLRLLGAGYAVHCQKPLGRSGAECEAVVAAARRADRLLGVDLSYRHLAAVAVVRESLRQREIGHVYAADLVFHNAYGPDKAWFLDRRRSGGGCVIDLGVHLVDLGLWLLGRPEVVDVRSRLFANGEPVRHPVHEDDPVEDHAVATLDLATGAVLRLACSWFGHAGQEAVIEVVLHGTAGSLVVRNVDGSFYDFVAGCRRGTKTEVLTAPPDEWGGRAGVAWAERLGAGAGFDEDAEEIVEVGRVLDRVYAG